MTIDQVREKLEPWLAKHRRPAWKPAVEEADGPRAASKFGGTPWIGKDAAWPACGCCKKPLQLFLQLDLGDLPEELGQRFGTGLLQLFYCTRDDCQGNGGWEPFGDDLSRVRVIQPTGRASSAQQEGLPAKRIVGWQRFLDLPTPQEHDELGLSYTYNFKAGTVTVECQQLGLVFKKLPADGTAEDIANSQAGDKLGGWPPGFKASSIQDARGVGLGWSTCSSLIQTTTCRSCSGTWVVDTSRSVHSTRMWWRSGGRAHELRAGVSGIASQRPNGRPSRGRHPATAKRGCHDSGKGGGPSA